MTYQLIQANANNLPLQDDTVDLIITSPPYFALRSYRDDGEHYDDQIGSEATPTQFLNNLIACTAEMKRVLKPSGSIFVNLGDTYMGSGGYNNSNIGAGERGPVNYQWGKRGNGADGQEADWTEANAAWLAGIIDSDGSISIHKTNPKKPTHNPSYVPWVRIGQMRPEAVNEAHRITGVGKVFTDKRGVHNWHVASQQAAYILQRIWPWLRIKQPQALAAIELARHVTDVGATGKKPLTDDETRYRQLIRDTVLALNQGDPTEWIPLRTEKLPLPRHSKWRPRQKSLNGLPWRYALRCIDDLNLILRSEIIWHKPNGLPESVTDRTRRNHEQWFHMVKEPRYYTSIDHIREPSQVTPGTGDDRPTYDSNSGHNHRSMQRRPDLFNPLGRLPGSVWTIPTEPLTNIPPHLPQHYAAFPQEWPRRLILAFSPTGICVECGTGRRPVTTTTYNELHTQHHQYGAANIDNRDANRSVGTNHTQIIGEECDCPTPTAPTTPAVVLDPFAGTGTVPGVAHTLGRHGIGTDLSHDYLQLAQWRIQESGHFEKSLRRSVNEGAEVPFTPPPTHHGMESML